MKAHIRCNNNKITVEVEGGDVKSLFREIASVQEILDCDSTCGMCGSADIKFRRRTPGKFEYFEVSCNQCFARLSFGQKQDGGDLFPKRKDADGVWLENRGWSKYVKEAE